MAVIIGMFHLPRPTGRIAVPDTQAVLMITTKLDIRLLTRLDIAEDNREMTDLQTGTSQLFVYIYLLSVQNSTFS